MKKQKEQIWVKILRILLAGIFIFSGVIDVADGYIARKLGQITAFGKIVDPLADKLMQSAAILCLFMSKKIPIWIFLLFVSKELFLMFGYLFFYRKTKLITQSSWYGKAGSVLIYAAVIFVAFLKDRFPTAALILFVCAVAWAFVSLCMYIVERKKEADALKKNDLDAAQAEAAARKDGASV